MVKYRLSKSVSILEPVSYYMEADMPQAYLHGHYVLVDQIDDWEFLINETVKYFIDKFSFPKTQAEVLKEIAQDVNSNIEAIKENCSSFFNYLHKRKIVVPENWVEQTMDRQPLFKEGDYIGSLCISEIIANKHCVDIYLATDKANNTAYVIKLLNPKKTSDSKQYEEELTDMEHEYEMLQKAKHIPFISQAYAFHKTDQQSAYIILEHIKGKSLSRFLRQTENLTETDCIQIIKDILQAFSLLHECGLIHGDIHTSNVMVDENKNIKIIDLGLSHDATYQKNEVLRIGGVNFYMPPERINISSHDKFTKEADFCSDVYQIGLVIYYIFYKKEPFDGFIWEELAENIKKSEALFPTHSFLNYEVPQPIIAIIKKCLHKNPRKRYQSAIALFDDFKKKVLS